MSLPISQQDLASPFRKLSGTLRYTKSGHVAYPNLSGDTSTGHDNVVGDLLFRTIVNDTVNRVFKEGDASEAREIERDLGRINRNVDYYNRPQNYTGSGFDFESIKTAEDAVRAANDPRVRQFLGSKAQHTPYH